MILLELGGGSKPHPQVTYGIDSRHAVNAPTQDATQIPWLVGTGELADGSIDKIYSSHFMEHVPKGQATLAVMNEAWRVLRPGGTFTIICPLIGYTDRGRGHLVERWEPYADPTHVQGWWFPESLLYFCEDGIEADADYGISKWRLKHWEVRDFWEGEAVLVKP